MDRLSLIFGVHSHQPVGNFDFVFQNAFEQAYLPFLEVVREHPSIAFSLHFSGVLFDWLESHHPDFLDGIKRLTDKGQVELLTGGYYEPILSVLPDADKLGQIAKLSSYIQRRFDFVPKGAWVAERVWEPHLAKPLAEAKVEFTVLDDSLFRFAGLKESELSGYYVTEEQGSFLKVFPISKKLRYLIPFAETQKVLEHLRELYRAGNSGAAVIVDDGEKFGVWPGTHAWVYEKGWLHRFLRSIEENQDWIQAVTFSDFLASQAPVGRIYLPSGSYEEMMEWALPFEAQVSFEAALERIKTIDSPDQIAPFLKGGFWRNFLVKYPESNHLHKRMLGISKKIRKVEEEGITRLKALSPEEGGKGQIANNEIQVRAREELYRGQCNDVYWHGIFGGIYLPHLRHAAYKHLIRSESLIDGLTHERRSWAEWSSVDLDGDGFQDLLVTTPSLALFFDMHRGGSLWELDYRPKEINLINTMTRRPEAYHLKIGKEMGEGPASSQGIKTIHEMEPTQDQVDMEGLLCYDWYAKACLLDHFLGPDTTIVGFSRCQYSEFGDFVNQKYDLEVQRGKEEIHLSLRRDGRIWFPQAAIPIRVEKKILLRGDGREIFIQYSIENMQSADIQTVFGTEFNFNFLAESEPDRYYKINGRKPDDSRLGSQGESDEVNRVELVDETTGISVLLHWEIPACLWRFPIYTVSQSERGFEKIYQGSSLLPHWRLELPRWGRWNLGIRLCIGDQEGF